MPAVEALGAYERDMIEVMRAQSGTSGLTLEWTTGQGLPFRFTMTMLEAMTLYPV